MPLTSEQYKQLTQCLSSPPRRHAAPAYEGPERRESARSQARGAAELRLPAHAPWSGGYARGRSVTVYVHDISTGGVGLLSGTAVRPCSVVELALSNGHDDLTLRCAVRHCTVLAVGLYGLGVDVVGFEVTESKPDCPAAEAAAAWAGFFTNERATTSLAVAG